MICLDCYYRTPNPDTYLMLKSAQGKALKKDLVQAREMGESVVTLIAGGYVPSTHEHSLEHNSTDLSSAARCQPYTTYDKGAKFKVICLDLQNVPFGSSSSSKAARC